VIQTDSCDEMNYSDEEISDEDSSFYNNLHESVLHSPFDDTEIQYETDDDCVEDSITEYVLDYDISPANEVDDCDDESSDSYVFNTFRHMHLHTDDESNMYFPDFTISLNELSDEEKSAYTKKTRVSEFRSNNIIVNIDDIPQTRMSTVIVNDIVVGGSHNTPEHESSEHKSPELTYSEHRQKK
jgi:hypothetical protein